MCRIYATKGHIWCVTQPGVLGLNAHSEQCACVNGTQARCYTQWGVRYPQERALPDVAWTMVSRGRTGGAGRTDTQEAEGMRYGGEAARARPKALVRTHDSGAFRRQGLEEVTVGLSSCEEPREYPGRCPGWAGGLMGCGDWWIVGPSLSSLLI